MQEGTGQPDWLGTICEFFTNSRKLPQFVNELCSGHMHPKKVSDSFNFQQHGNNFALVPAQTFSQFDSDENSKGFRKFAVLVPVFDIMHFVQWGASKKKRRRSESV